MRDVLVDLQLDHLRVDHQHLELARERLVEERDDHRVEADRLARARGARDEQVGHPREVGHDRVAVDVLPERERQQRLRLHEGLRVDDVPQQDDLPLPVRHLDADRRGSGDPLDAHRLRLEREREIVAEVDDFRVLDARGRLELVRRDDRAGVIRGDLAVHRELLATVLDQMAELEIFLVHLLVDRRLVRRRREEPHEGKALFRGARRSGFRAARRAPSASASAASG